MKKRKKKKISALLVKDFPLLMVEILMSIGASLCITRGNALIGGITDSVIAGETVDYKYFAMIFAGLVTGGFICSFLSNYFAGTFANRVSTGYRRIIGDKIYKVDYSYISSQNTGTVINKITGDIGEISTFLEATLPQMISHLVATVIYAAYIATLHFGLFAVMVVSYPLIFYIANGFAKKMQKFTKTFRQKTDTIMNIAQSGVKGILVVRAFGLEKLMGEKMNQAAGELVENEEKRVAVTNTAMVIRQMLQWLPNIICAVYAAFLVSHGELGIGNLLSFVLILGFFVDNFVGLPFMFVDASTGIVSIERIESFLAKKEEDGGTYTGLICEIPKDNAKDNKAYSESDDAGKACREEIIRMEHVSFSYDRFERRISSPPIQMCRVLSGGVGDAYFSKGLKAPTESWEAPCVHEQVAKADCECPLYSDALGEMSVKENGQQVLTDVSLSVRHGDNIALIGESGGGKSTIIGLLCGLYDSYGGKITFYGHDLREWKLQALRERISLVSQDVFLFPASIEENVLFGRENASHEEVVDACRRANIHDFIESLPDGYSTIIGECGTRLSGGQKQRLSIARAILKDAPVLIMDEPTSAVDVDTENEIQRAMEELSANKTCITIAHRLNTIKNCSSVYRMAQGRLEREELADE